MKLTRGTKCALLALVCLILLAIVTTCWGLAWPLRESMVGCDRCGECGECGECDESAMEDDDESDPAST